MSATHLLNVCTLHPAPSDPQGLQCCLGVRATDTGRYKALKEFVQRGYEGQAVVRLTLVSWLS